MREKIKHILNRAGFFTILCVTAVCLSGCASVNEKIVIDKQGNATLEEKLLFENSVMEFIGDEFSSKVDELSEKEDSNFHVETIDENDKKGLKLTRKIDNIKDNDLDFEDFFVENVIKTEDDEALVKVDKKFFTTDYDINFNVELIKDVDYFKTEFNIQIPVEAKSNNATSVDKTSHTYSWNITEPKQNISLKYTTVNTMNVLACVAPVILVFIAGLLMLLLRRKEEAPATKKCPYCFEEIPSNATTCPVCNESLVKENNSDKPEGEE